MRPLLARASVIALGAAVAFGCGCSGDGAADGGGEGSALRRDGPPPSFAAAAARYNERVAGAAGRLTRLRAGAVVRMSFIDQESGQRRDEQGEGLLQAIAPDRFALSVNKVGTPLLWIGCDASRSWWFNLQAEPVRATIGGHEAFLREARARMGLAVGPRELALLIGMAGIETGPGIAGGTQWSSDGTLLGITTRASAGAGGARRVWVDPETFHARKVEWYERADGEGGANLVADLEGEERVDAPELRGARPAIPARVSVHHVESGTFIRLDISSAESGGSDGSGRVKDGAFDFDELVKYHRAERVEDLDAGR